MSPELCQLLAYWRGLCSGKSLPERSQLDLRQLAPLLSWMFILEMGADGSLRYRLAGSSLEEGVGRGMAGRTYSDIFQDHEQAAIMEELYATALVQGCGLVRAGSFSLDENSHFDLEVLAVPFGDSRAMGGTVLVGVVRPFDILNEGFLDHWGGFKQQLTSLMVVPSPRLVTHAQLSERVINMLDAMDVELRALDVRAVLDRFRRGETNPEVQEIPSLDLAILTADQTLSLN
ncbi:MAG: PAS domain-containing protein [Alphaproteobacteria bacterium]|nr:PAS domain-containing protein [Alphaproteobacteria bacterium]